MTSCDVLQVALAQIAPQEKYTDYHLIHKTPQGGRPRVNGNVHHHALLLLLLYSLTERVVGDDECPLLLLTGTAQLVLRNKQQSLPSPLTLTPPECSPTSSHHHSPTSPSSPNHTLSLDHTPSTLSVQRSWLSMHHDLITALSELTAALQQPGGGEERVRHGSRESLLEQSLVQQNQIVEMLRSMVASLESENEAAKKKASGLEAQVHKLSLWKARARQAEDRLRDLTESSGGVTSGSGGVVSFSALAGYEKMLSDKDKMIASLKSRVDEEGSGDQQGRSVSTEAKLAAERVRVMELEEELLTAREESMKACRDLSECRSDVMRRESEVQYLRHEVEAVKRVGQQQQDIVMGFRTALQDRDAQIASLTRVLEKNSEERKRRPTMGRNSSSQSIFNLLLGREVFTVEVRRNSEDGELGFSVSRFEMPISSRMSSLIVRAVKEGSSVQGLLLPGDEILEVNGLNCRSAASQRKAVETLERGKGSLKLVAAREQGPADFVGRMRSTPITSETSKSTLWATANDASFTPISPLYMSHEPSPLPDSPPHYHLSLPTSPDSAPPYTPGDISLASHPRPQPIGQVKMIEASPADQFSNTTNGGAGGGENEFSSDFDSEEQRTREEGEQWPAAEVEEELHVTRSELEAVKSEQKLTTAENFDLQQQVKSGAMELSDVRRQVEELQQVLVGAREKMEREEEKTHSLEEQSTTLQRTVAEINTTRDRERQRASEAEEESLKLKMDVEREKSELSTRLATLQSHNEQLRAEVKARTAQGEAAETLARECESKQERERKEGEQKILHLTTEVQGLREQLVRDTSSSQSEAQNLQHQLTTMRTLLVEAEKKEVEMKMENRHLRQAADESNKQLTELHATRRSLQQRLAVIGEQAESKTLECESLTLGVKRADAKLQANKDMSSRQRKEIDNLRRKNKQLLVERVGADEERSKAEVQLRISRAEQAQVRERLQSETGERDELFSQLETVVAENTTVQQQLSTDRDKLGDLEKELQQLNQQLEEARERLEVVDGEKKGLQSELSLERTKTDGLKQSLAAAEAAMEEVEAGKKKSDNLVASMMFVHEQDQGRIRELEETLATAQKGAEESHEEMNSVQTKTNAELQQLESECATLRERARGLSEQLNSERERRANDVAALRETLSHSEQNVSHLQVELEALQSANSINKATITQLQTASEQAEQERERVQASLEDMILRNQQLQSQLDNLQSHARDLETESVALRNERDGLLESCADEKLSLKQARAQVDTLSARVEATQQSLTATEQRLVQATQGEREMKNKFTELENKFRECEKNLEMVERGSREVTLSLHRREEEVSQLTTQLELACSGQQQLQSSVARLQTATQSQERKIKSLEEEREKSKVAVKQLQTERENLKKIVTSLKQEKAQKTEQQKVELESLTQQLEEKTATENKHLTTIQRLERLHSEEKGTVQQLLAAQEALKSSLTSLGDEREGEVVRLREQIVSLERSLVETQQRASEIKSREERVHTELSSATAAAQTASERCSELEDENEQRREEVERFRETQTQVTELLRKVDVLEGSQRERNDKLVATRSELESTTSELQSVRTENAALLERVGEVAAASLSLAEKTAELERVKGELATEAKARQAVAEEKEQLLGVLRRLEVEKHTASVAIPHESQSVSQEADQEKLLEAVREREEEAARLREYVGKLLSAVVEKAPFILERME